MIPLTAHKLEIKKVNKEKTMCTKQRTVHTDKHDSCSVDT